MSELAFTETASAIAAILAALAAILSGWCAFLSFRLSSKLRDEMKSDERIIISKIIHPVLDHHDHEKCVVKCDIFNKSKRKVFINKVQAYDQGDNIIAITWSNHIDRLGMPQNPCELIGVVDTEELFMRHNLGEEIDYCRLEISHSFSSIPSVVVYDPVSEFIGLTNHSSRPQKDAAA